MKAHLFALSFFLPVASALAQPCDFESCHHVPMSDIPARAQAGDCSCQLFEARAAARRGEPTPFDLKQTRKQLMAEAERGDAFALEVLGDFELYGVFGPKNAAAALVLYKKAADRGNEAAEEGIASLYENGAPGIPRDIKLAKQWYARAAAPSHGGRMLMLAQRLSRGELGPADKVEAQAWVLLSQKFVNDGTPTAYDDYEKALRQSLTPSELQQADERRAALEAEYFKGSTPKPMLSAAELAAREIRVRRLADAMNNNDANEREREFNKVLEEYRKK